jgi:transposase-like protein
MEPPTKRKNYEASFKLRVIKMSKELNSYSAARASDITEKTVRE